MIKKRQRKERKKERTGDARGPREHRAAGGVRQESSHSSRRPDWPRGRRGRGGERTLLHSSVETSYTGQTLYPFWPWNPHPLPCRQERTERGSHSTRTSQGNVSSVKPMIKVMALSHQGNVQFCQG